MSILKVLAAAAAMLAFAGAAFAQTPASKILDGRWEGAINTGAGELHLVLRVKTDPAGTTILADSPDQGVSDMKTSNITMKDGALGFEVPGAASRYDGKLSADGKTITGGWSQGGLVLPLDFTLKPGGSMTTASGGPSPAVQGLDGKWSGLINVGDQPVQFRLMVATDKAGTTAIFNIVEQGLTLAVKSITRDGQKVKLTLAEATVSFEGELSADGKTIAGQLREQGSDFPLTLMRQ